MKKLLSILGAVGLVASTSAVLVSCSPEDNEIQKDDQYTMEKVELIKEDGNSKDLSETYELGDFNSLEVGFTHKLKDNKPNKGDDDVVHILFGRVKDKGAINQATVTLTANVAGELL